MLGGCVVAEARKGGFWSYAAGTAYRMLIAHHVGGLEINNHRTTLPMSKGLSSSAAICVSQGRADERGGGGSLMGHAGGVCAAQGYHLLLAMRLSRAKLGLSPVVAAA
jgi:hypothetical protein